MKLVIYLQSINNSKRIFLLIFNQLSIQYRTSNLFAINLQGYTSRIDTSFDLLKQRKGNIRTLL